MSSARPAPDRIGAPHALSYRFPQRRHCDADGRPSAGHAARTGAAAGCGRRIGIAFRHRQFDTDLDHDGDFRWSAGIASGAVTRQITPRFSAGLALRYDYEDWRFSRPVAFGGVAPWTHLFPFVILRWQINDRWRLGNPFPAGPAGGAGLELTYAPDAHWEFATGGGKRSTRYRLDGAGIASGGIGENRVFPVFARLTRNFGAHTRFDLYAGVALRGRLLVADSGDDTVAKDDYSNAPLIGLTLAHRF